MCMKEKMSMRRKLQGYEECKQCGGLFMPVHYSDRIGCIRR